MSTRIPTALGAALLIAASPLTAQSHGPGVQATAWGPTPTSVALTATRTAPGVSDRPDRRPAGPEANRQPRQASFVATATASTVMSFVGLYAGAWGAVSLGGDHCERCGATLLAAPLLSVTGVAATSWRMGNASGSSLGGSLLGSALGVAAVWASGRDMGVQPLITYSVVHGVVTALATR